MSGPGSSPSTGLEAARERLRGLYTEAGVELWLAGPHRLLGGERAIDLIERGETDRVLDVIEMLESGAVV